MRVRHLLLVVLVGLVSCLAEARQLAIVAESSATTTNLSASDLVKIFNAKTHHWPDGKPIVVVLRDPSSSEMEMVLHRLLNMTADETRAFIAAHPGEFAIVDSDAAVIRLVSSTRGAIGVVDLFSLTKDVNVIKIDGKLPVEQGYLLKGN
jgi:ABC-type phosphate transport system substrate-binding protein